MLVRVKAMLSPNELSTCVCAAKCSTVSMRSCRSTYETRSADVIEPLTKEKDGEPATDVVCEREREREETQRVGNPGTRRRRRDEWPR